MWRNYGADTLSHLWQFDQGDSILTLVGKGGGDILTRSSYRDFELVFDWWIEPGGNSGLFYRAHQGGPGTKIYEFAPEYQLLDDERHRDAAKLNHRSGALYDLYTPTAGAVRPAGNWNTSVLRIQQDSVEHHLNGVKVVSYRLGSPDYTARIAQSKFAKWTGFSKATEGPIGLQDHGDRVSFRRMRIRPL